LIQWQDRERTRYAVIAQLLQGSMHVPAYSAVVLHYVSFLVEGLRQASSFSHFFLCLGLSLAARIHFVHAANRLASGAANMQTIDNVNLTASLVEEAIYPPVTPAWRTQYYPASVARGPCGKENSGWKRSLANKVKNSTVAGLTPKRVI
jgi:hypothetical protein